MVVQPGAALTCCCWRIDALRQACGVLVALKQTLRTVLNSTKPPSMYGWEDCWATGLILSARPRLPRALP
jgi:hypothetical protein